MNDQTREDYRRARLAALVKHQDFGGKASLGRALGYKDGAYVRQMIQGERPITEKLVDQIETMLGGRFSGWFQRQPDELSELALDLAKRFDQHVPEAIRRSTHTLILAQIEHAAAAARLPRDAPAHDSIALPRRR